MFRYLEFINIEPHKVIDSVQISAFVLLIQVRYSKIKTSKDRSMFLVDLSRNILLSRNAQKLICLEGWKFGNHWSVIHVWHYWSMIISSSLHYFISKEYLLSSKLVNKTSFHKGAPCCNKTNDAWINTPERFAITAELRTWLTQYILQFRRFHTILLYWGSDSSVILKSALEAKGSGHVSPSFAKN